MNVSNVLKGTKKPKEVLKKPLYHNSSGPRGVFEGSVLSEARVFTTNRSSITKRLTKSDIRGKR
ncbi:hypothetical protein, partial [uncultured Nitrospira sp.]|uniref:hypothetical protein n=1 Tax=uncultured Nitrospira sp. TaxID=157176 RepID=UPI00314021F3